MESHKTNLFRHGSQSPFTGPVLMISAAALFAGLDIMVKLISPEFGVWQIGFYRFFGGMVLLLAIFGGGGEFLKSENIWLLVIRGCTGSIAFLTIVTAIRLLPISTALVIFYAYPAFSALFSYVFYGERIGRMHMACIIAVVLGVAVLFDFHPSGSFWAQFMAILSCAFAGMTVTFIRALRKTSGSVVIYLSFCIMGSLVTLPSFLMNPILPANLMDTAMILGIIITSLFAQLLMNQGFSYCRGWEGGVLMSSEVVFAAVVGICFLGDPAGWRFWIGGGMILGSVLLLNRVKPDPSETKNTIG